MTQMASVANEYKRNPAPRTNAPNTSTSAMKMPCTTVTQMCSSVCSDTPAARSSMGAMRSPAVLHAP